MTTYVKNAGQSGLTEDFVIRNQSNEIWNGSAFVTFNGSNWASYVIAMAEQGSTGFYYGTFPATISQGSYFITVHSRTTPATPAQTDEVIGSGTFNWTGTEEEFEVDGTDETVALITTAEAKAFLGIPTATTSENTMVNAIINSMSKFFTTYCGRNFINAEYTEYYDGTDTDKLFLKNYPIITLDSLYIDATRVFAASSLISSAYYLLNKASGIVTLFNYGIFPCGKGNIKVTYDAGYATDSIPYDLKHACRLAVLHAYKRHYQDKRIGLVSETIGDRTMSYANEDLPITVKSILNRYKKAGIASYGFV